MSYTESKNLMRSYARSIMNRVRDYGVLAVPLLPHTGLSLRAKEKVEILL